MAPFILRAVTLAGVDSRDGAPSPTAEKAWARLATDLDFALLDKMTERAVLTDLPKLGEDIIARQGARLVVVDVNG